LIDQFTPHEQEQKYGNTEGTDYGVRELILLDENEKPVKAWNLAGRVSLLIGRDNPQEPVDVDLEECEYSALIDEQHAVLNYCMDAWYVEDLNSMNGIRVRKISDGLCYRVSRNRPCRLESGDMLFIANTKLLIT
jgi:pSer/pThr/pTyr-binding forkhead associated (FHA) protein